MGRGEERSRFKRAPYENGTIDGTKDCKGTGTKYSNRQIRTF
jgi:hypothetical protein